MSTIALRPTAPWHALYMAALFEADRSQLRNRITEAERALMTRERELFTTQRIGKEQQAINNALNALRALRDCHGLR